MGGMHRSLWLCFALSLLCFVFVFDLSLSFCLVSVLGLYSSQLLVVAVAPLGFTLPKKKSNYLPTICK